MAVTINVPGQDTFNQRGIPDFQKAFQSGLDTYIKANQAQYAPAMSQAALQQTQAQTGQIGAQTALQQQQAQGAQIANQYAPQVQQANIAQTQAQTGQLGAQTALQQQQAQGAQISNQYAPQMQQLDLQQKAAEAAFNMARARLYTNGGVNIDPTTGAVLSIGGMGGGRGGGGATVLQNGQVITKPTQAAVTAQLAQTKASVTRDALAAQMSQPYVGVGSSLQMSRDYANYLSTKDPEAANRLVNAAVSNRLIPDLGAAQINAMGVTSSQGLLDHQKEQNTQGWATILPEIVNNLPPELQAQAAAEHTRRLARTTQATTEYGAKGYPVGVTPQNGGPQWAQTSPQLQSINPGVAQQPSLSGAQASIPSMGGGAYGYTADQIERTARKYGMDPSEVIAKLQEKRNGQQ